MSVAQAPIDHRTVRCTDNAKGGVLVHACPSKLAAGCGVPEADARLATGLDTTPRIPATCRAWLAAWPSRPAGDSGAPAPRPLSLLVNTHLLNGLVWVLENGQQRRHACMYALPLPAMGLGASVTARAPCCPYLQPPTCSKPAVRPPFYARPCVRHACHRAPCADQLRLHARGAHTKSDVWQPYLQHLNKRR